MELSNLIKYSITISSSFEPLNKVINFLIIIIILNYNYISSRY